MRKVYSWRMIVPMLLAMVLSTACTDDDNEGGSSPSAFKPTSVTQLDFKRYEIDLHDDGTNVYCPFATLADIYSDCNFHYAACHDDKVMVSTALDMYTMNTLDPDYAHFYDLDFLTTKMQELYK